tara:strand:+ start:51 stop:608 length:558 start_codon:yes stop_codon:yes gene_type:complete
MGGGSKPAPPPVIQQRQNPYDDAWIHDKFASGQSKYDELSNFMNQRKAALAQDKYYNVGGGMSVKQDNLGEYFSGRLANQEQAFNQRLADIEAAGQAQRQQMGSVYDNRLADITAASGANQAAIQAQQEEMARQAERARIGKAYGDPSVPGVTGVQTGKKQKLGSYGGTGSGFNRAGLRIQNLNI